MAETTAFDVYGIHNKNQLEDYKRYVSGGSVPLFYNSSWDQKSERKSLVQQKSTPSENIPIDLSVRQLQAFYIGDEKNFSNRNKVPAVGLRQSLDPKELKRLYNRMY